MPIRVSTSRRFLRQKHEEEPEATSRFCRLIRVRFMKNMSRCIQRAGRKWRKVLMLDGPASALPLTQTLSNIYGRRSATPDVPGPDVNENQQTRYDNTGIEEQLPPPPSPPQLKEAAQLDGVPRPNSVDRILHSDGVQHIAHDTLNKGHDSWQGHDSDQDCEEPCPDDRDEAERTNLCKKQKRTGPHTHHML